MNRESSDPEAAVREFILLDEIAGKLGAILKLMQQEEPLGDVLSTQVPVTTEPVEVNLGIWVRATLHSEPGSSHVYIYNTRQYANTRDSPLKANRSVIIDRKRRTDKKFYLVCASGSATVTIFYE